MINNNVVVMTGTAPFGSTGGVATAQAGFIKALELQGFYVKHFSTHDLTFLGKFYPWMVSFFSSFIFYAKYMLINRSVCMHFANPGAGVSLFRECVIAYVARLFGVPSIVQLHASEVETYLESSFMRFYLKVVLSPYKIICAPTGFLEQSIRSISGQRDFFSLSNPVDDAIVDIDHRLSGSDKYVLSMSRLEPGKGFETIIRAVPFINEDIRLVIAGDGSIRDDLISLVEKLCVADRVSFVGWVSGDDKLTLISKATVFCLPSMNDSFGMVYPEAMIRGVPIVAYKYGAIPFVVKDNVAGLLSRSNSPKEIASLINVISSSDMNLKYSLGAREWALSKFSYDSVGKDIMRICNSL